MTRETRIELKPPTPAQETAGLKNRVFLDGREVTEEIRTAEVAQAASRLATIAGVREVLVAEQQRAGQGGGVVMEGRDIGTVVFPKAELKIFLEASAETRAQRRWKEHQEKGENFTLAGSVARRCGSGTSATAKERFRRWCARRMPCCWITRRWELKRRRD